MASKKQAAPSQKRTRSRAKALTWDQAFLKALRKLGNVTVACEVAKISRRSVYDRRAADAEFAAAWDDALEESIDRLEAEARRRAEEGTLKPVFYQGDPVGFIREYSDSLMTLLLKAHRPSKFKDRQEITGKDGGAIEIKPIDYRAAIAALAPGPMDDSDPSGQGQDSGDGTPVGEDRAGR